jgi:hypothetical protein
VKPSLPSPLSSFPGARALASLVVVLASLVVVLGVAGCYNPTINGAFKCNQDYVPPDDCPAGYHCGAGNLCVKGPMVDSGVDKPIVKPPVDAPMEMPVDMPAPPIDMGMEVACLMPVSGCTPDTTKMCDPVCQSGCAGCQEKCSVNTKGALTCNVAGSGRTRGAFEFCDISSDGFATQTDNCAPGSVCRTDGCGTRCYHFCKTDNDCPMSTCTVDVGSGMKVCDVNFTDCNPVKNGTPDKCGTDTDKLSCYLSPAVGDRTYCDCPFQAQGVNASCSVSRDCFAGLVCVGAIPTCHKTCGLLAGVSPDCAGSTCVPLNGSTKFGYCN